MHRHLTQCIEVHATVWYDCCRWVSSYTMSAVTSLNWAHNHATMLEVYLMWTERKLKCRFLCQHYLQTDSVLSVVNNSTYNSLQECVSLQLYTAATYCSNLQHGGNDYGRQHVVTVNPCIECFKEFIVEIPRCRQVVGNSLMFVSISNKCAKFRGITSASFCIISATNNHASLPCSV